MERLPDAYQFKDPIMFLMVVIAKMNANLPEIISLEKYLKNKASIQTIGLSCRKLLEEILHILVGGNSQSSLSDMIKSVNSQSFRDSAHIIRNIGNKCAHEATSSITELDQLMVLTSTISVLVLFVQDFKNLKN